ncbi:unnamed protein product, partial [Ilex paraguariensis]
MEITIDHKHFKVKFEGLHGELIRITEWNRFGYFSCLVNRSCVRWLKEMFSKALSKNRQDIFLRKFRRDEYCMWMELENSRFGEFARITQMMNNGGRNTLIQEEENQSLMVVSKCRVKEQGNGAWAEMHKENTPANVKGMKICLKKRLNGGVL